MNQSIPGHASYGSWQSPITTELMTAARPSYDYPSTCNNKLYWVESRPWENGRCTVVEKDTSGKTRDLLPSPLSVSSRVHEYGGTPYIVLNNMLYFCLQDDQRIYAVDISQDKDNPRPLTPAAETSGCEYRFADFCYDRIRNRLICVCEIHTSNRKEAENCIVGINLDVTVSDSSAVIEKLVSGADFYAYPGVNPDNNQLCWVSWNHPNMPWDSSQLFLADISLKGDIHQLKLVAGENPENRGVQKPQSIFQPQWSPQGELHFVSDSSNWWNLYRVDAEGSIDPLCPLDAEFATPLWVLGMSTYGFCDDGTIVCCFSQNGKWQLAKIIDHHAQLISTPYTQISAVHCAGKTAWFLGSASNIETELATVEINDKATVRVAHRSASLPFGDGYLSQPIALDFPTGKKGEARAHSFYYPPKNCDYPAPPGESPPLIVICHGGPTGATSTGLNLKIQFWTSRGFAVLDINYRGSTGYGRQYRELLNGAWGVADIEDVVYGSRYAIEHKLADPDKVAIRGSSAGGYTVLAALTFTDLFKAGACLYGIGDLETLATDTHKFESRYLDHLVGPYPEAKSVYHQRSPIHFTDRLNCPVIFFQGLEDKVVPPQQAKTMVESLRQKQLPVAYLPFSGEGHGFRKAETIRRVFDAELYFYSKVFGFQIDLTTAPVTIDNLNRINQPGQPST